MRKAIENERLPQITAEEAVTASKLQQQFNKKIRKVDKLKKELAEKKANLELGRKRVQQELQPLIVQIVEKRIELVHLLDRACDLSMFKKREKEKLAFLIEDMTYELIATHGREELLQLHDKYAKRSFSESKVHAEEEAKDLAENMLKNIFGVDIAAEDPDDFDHLQAQLDRETEQREQQRQQRQAGRKTKAQAAKEEKLKAEMNNISKASRRVYTELAKQLHPDTEQDEQAKAHKEEAMKRVTQAYHQDDFFGLLQLQMEFLQGQALARLPEEQLTYYIRLLDDQARDLQEEHDNFLYSPDGAFYNRFCGSSGTMNQKIKFAKEDLSMEFEQLKLNLRALEEPQNIKAFIKGVR